MDQDGVAAPKGSRDLAPTLHGVDFVLCGISTVFTILRVFTRIVVTKDLYVLALNAGKACMAVRMLTQVTQRRG